MPGAGARVQVQVVARGDLPQPRVLRTPRVVHEHRPLRDGVEGERRSPLFLAPRTDSLPFKGRAGVGMGFRPDLRRLERLIPDRQRIKIRSEEHTSELQSLMRISYAVFCLKKQKNTTTRLE